MGQKSGEGDQFGVIDEAALVGAVVAGLVMLQAEVSDVVTESNEKMIIAIMTRAEKRTGFRYQLVKVCLRFR